jgi:hypothetical protein
MIEILFLASNRLEFTRESLRWLFANTEWQHVSKLVVYDDNSVDGTREYLRSVIGYTPCPMDLVEGVWGGPVAIMNDYIGRGNTSQWFAKIDNDTVVPRGWLGECLRTLDRYPVDLLGIEAIRPGVELSADRKVDWASHIGGIGMMRRSVFLDRPLPEPDGRFGFTAWQEKHDAIRKAWMQPSLPVILLDHVPFAPWSYLSLKYEAEGWQRHWSHYGPDSELMEWWR